MNSEVSSNNQLKIEIIEECIIEHYDTIINNYDNRINSEFTNLMVNLILQSQNYKRLIEIVLNNIEKLNNELIDYFVGLYSELLEKTNNPTYFYIISFLLDYSK